MRELLLQQLQTVDLSQTDVIEILGSTFAHCSQLQQLSLSRNLRIIEQEAFHKCTSLQGVYMPPSLLYIARRAFAGCTQLRAVRKQRKSKTWRGTYARLNAFDKCEQLDKPQSLSVPLWLKFSVQTHLIDGQEAQGILLKRRDSTPAWRLFRRSAGVSAKGGQVHFIDWLLTWWCGWK